MWINGRAMSYHCPAKSVIIDIGDFNLPKNKSYRCYLFFPFLAFKFILKNPLLNWYFPNFIILTYGRNK